MNRRSLIAAGSAAVLAGRIAPSEAQSNPVIRVAGLARGTISAALQGEPYLSAGKADLRALGIPFEALGKPFYINIYTASRTWLAANPATAKKVAGVLYEAGRWANTHRAESAAIESKYLKLSLDVTRSMARSVFATSFDPTLLSPVLDLGARYQLTPRPVQASEISLTL